ncbi:MAG: hypothetical protein C0627_11095 [Sulfurimonas sp.]|nr:MAG: hypothetical protein C0627_11095 [Sulfurimonas sp.]
MLPYSTTHIDTLSIQINCSRDNNKQREILLGIKEHLKVMFNPYIDPVEYKAGFDTRIEHKVYCNNRTVLSIQTGFSNNNYYVKITFAGLQTYDYLVDNTSYQYLWTIAAYINSNQLGLNITELDIAIDVPNVSFNDLIAFCSSHTSRTVYHGLGEIQIYDDETSYVEKFKNRIAASVAIKRAYLYN